jgi:hypothetical protein
MPSFALHPHMNTMAINNSDFILIKIGCSLPGSDVTGYNQGLRLSPYTYNIKFLSPLSLPSRN